MALSYVGVRTKSRRLNYNSGGYTTRPLFKGSNVWIVSTGLQNRWRDIEDKKIQKQKPKTLGQFVVYNQKQELIRKALRG